MVFVGENLKPGAALAKRLGTAANGLLAKAAAAEKFKGKAKSAMTVVAPASLSVDRIVVVGLGGEKDLPKTDFAQLGGVDRRQGRGTDRDGGGRSARALIRRPTTSPIWRSARACAATASIATRPRRTTTSPSATTHADLAGRGSRRRQEGPQGPRRRSRRASSSRAISSTSRRMSSARRNSRPAPRP